MLDRKAYVYILSVKIDNNLDYNIKTLSILLYMQIHSFQLNKQYFLIFVLLATNSSEFDLL